MYTLLDRFEFQSDEWLAETRRFLEKAVEQRRAALAQEKLPERSAWRDRRLMALVAHRRSQPSE